MSGLAELEVVQRLNKDIKLAALTLSDDEARFLVDAYYQMQADRIRAGNQTRALGESAEPNDALAWLSGQSGTLEKQLARMLDVYSNAQPLGRWARSIVGIGPVISAGLLAHIDIAKAPTAGHIWNYAGLNPTVTWEKGKKRPWNATLKTLCWKIGESFVKVSGNESDYYGHAYKVRKELYEAKNAEGGFAEAAANALTRKRFGDDTKAKAVYLSGKLPPAHLHAMAKRWAVKLFLSHYQHVGWELTTGAPPARPYVIEHLGHAHFLAPPNWPMTD
jgi:hypothetical protein